MNCHEFSQRMHERLDRRRPLDADSELCRHARQCESCRAELDAWRQIASLMPVAGLGPTSAAAAAPNPTSTRPAAAPEVGSRSRFATARFAVAGMAAAILLAAILGRQDSQSNSSPVTDFNRQQHETALAQSNRLDPSLWWRSVQDRDWVGQTMPTVKSVQEGVAPIGRSLMRAVTILTIGSRDQTS